jgi:uncharacterized protein YhbP (UPF0306 family)
VPIERSRRPVAAARIAAVARSLLDASTLCAIASVSPQRRAHVNTAYFAWSEALELVWLSERSASHSRNIRANPAVAIAVYDSGQTWGKPDRGIQLFGEARELPGPSAGDAEAVYDARFPAYRSPDFGRGYAFYGFRPRRIKLFDEPALGGGVFVTARVGRGGALAWEKTEVYRSGV